MSILTGDNPFYKNKENLEEGRFRYPAEEVKKLKEILGKTKTFTVVTSKPAKDWAIHWEYETDMGRISPQIWFGLGEGYEYENIAKKAGLGALLNKKRTDFHGNEHEDTDFSKVLYHYNVIGTSKGLEITYDEKIIEGYIHPDVIAFVSEKYTTKNFDVLLSLSAKHMAKVLNDWVKNMTKEEEERLSWDGYEKFFGAFGGMEEIRKAKFSVK